MAVKDYRAIAAKRISRPSQSTRKPNFLCYGRNKKGKSTFGVSAGIEKTLVIDPEDGTDEMRTSDPYRWPVERWEDFEEVLGYLKLGDHPYEWVCVDGLTRINNMALRFVMRKQEETQLDRQPGMVQQRDYGKSGEMMKEMITAFHNLKVGVIFTAQERPWDGVDSEEDEEIEDPAMMFIPDLPKGVRGHVESLVDVIGRIYVVKTEVRGKMVDQRRLWLGDSLKYTTGYRSDYTLPPMLKNPTVPKLVELMRTGTVIPRKRPTPPQS